MRYAIPSNGYRIFETLIMMGNTNNDELIEQYLQGELSGDLLGEFKEKFAADDQFRREVALQSAIIRNIKAAGRKEWAQKLETIHNNIGLPDNEVEEEKPIERKFTPVKSFYKKKYFLAVAATIIVLIFSALFVVTMNKKKGAERIYLAYYQPYPDLEPGTRGLPPGVPSVKKEAFKAYDEGNYLESIRLFNSVLEKGDDEIALFYLGNACLSADKPGEAESSFKKYLAKYKEFAPESRWYLSLSYLKQDKIKEARKLLEELAKENTDYSKKAEEVLGKL